MAERDAQRRPGFRPPPKRQRIAVVGGGLCGLTAALGLARKGYPVTVFERAARLGGALWDALPPDGVTAAERERIDGEMNGVEAAGVTVLLHSPVRGGAAVRALLDDFSAVVLAPGIADPEACLDLALLGPAADADVEDPRIPSTPVAGVFVARSALASTWSAVSSVADGNALALNVDLYVKGASLGVDGEESSSPTLGPVADLRQVERAEAVAPADPVAGYSAVEAAAEAARCLQCRCTECSDACVFLRHFDTYPGKAAREINNSLILTPGMGYRLSKEMVDSCMLCGLCAAVCPTDIDMGRLCLDARRTMVEKGYMTPAVHDFALRDMQGANSAAFALARHQPGRSSSAWAFFPGCQLPASHPLQVRAAYRHLSAALEGGVGLMLRCCGAPAHWAGREAAADDALRGLREEWESLGEPRLIVACSSCQRLLEERSAGLPCVSLWEVLDEIGVPAARRETRALALHDPCASRHTPSVQAAVRRLVRRSVGEFVELPGGGPLTQCCGYGGLQAVANPELLRKTVAERVGQDAHDYLAYCAMCRDLFVAAGKPTWHLIELLFGEGDGARPDRLGPRLTERYRARAGLKRDMLRELWGEVETAHEEDASVRLALSEQMRDKLAERLITHADVAAVIERAERTGERLVEPENGHFIAHARPQIITYWVEYSQAEDGGYVVHNAYSHRVQILADESANDASARS